MGLGAEINRILINTEEKIGMMNLGSMLITVFNDLMVFQ
jgi:hypothetical protein